MGFDVYVGMFVRCISMAISLPIHIDCLSNEVIYINVLFLKEGMACDLE